MNRVGFHSTHETQPSRMIYLDSTDAKHLTQLTSHYTYSFKDAIESAGQEAILVSLSSASIPYSFYNIRSGVNDVVGYNTGAYNPFARSTFDVPSGNYTAKALAAKIVEQFAAQTPSVVLSMTYDKETQKYIYKDTNDVSIHFHLETPNGISSSTRPTNTSSS